MVMCCSSVGMYVLPFLISSWKKRVGPRRRSRASKWPRAPGSGRRWSSAGVRMVRGEPRAGRTRGSGGRRGGNSAMRAVRRRPRAGGSTSAARRRRPSRFACGHRGASGISATAGASGRRLGGGATIPAPNAGRSDDPPHLERRHPSRRPRSSSIGRSWRDALRW